METAGGDQGERDRREGSAEVIRLRPLRVLIVSADRRFRSAMAMLIVRRGCCVFSQGSAREVAERLVRERVDVVLVDGAELLKDVADDVALADSTAPPVGVVLVGEPKESLPDGLRALPKWDSFDRLFSAVADADRARARPAAQSPTGLTQSPADLGVARASDLG